MSFRGQLIKLGFNTDGVSNALWQSAARYAVGCNVASGIALKIGGDSRTTLLQLAADGTTAIEITSAFTGATGLLMSGTFSTAAIQIGTDASKLTFANAADHAIDIATTCAQTTGTLQCVDIEHTQTGASYTLKIEALRVGVTSAVMTGDWCNAIVGVLTYTAPGTAAGGMAAAICAEVNLAAQSLGGGTYTLFHGYLGVPTSCVLENSTTHVVSLARFEAGGGAVASFDSYGQLFQIVGLTGAATKCVSLTSQTAKVLVGSSQRYMVLSQMEDGLGCGSSSTDMVLGTSITKRAIEVYTSSASTDTDDSIRPIFMRHTVLGTGGVGHRAEFHTRCDVVVGTWINALKGYMEFDASLTAGRTTGLASAICAELKMPNSAVSTGQYYPLEIEWVGQTNSGPGVHHGFITARCSGTRTNFDASGYLLHVSGLTAGATAMLSTTSQTLKCLIGASTTRYMVLSQMTDGLGLGVSGTRMELTSTSHAMDIYTNSTSLTGSMKTALIDHTYTGTDATAHNIEVFKVQLASAQNTGAWVNAIFGRVNYSSDGRAYGSASAICGEMSWPTTNTGAGTYTVFQAELDVPTAAGSQVGAEGSIIRASLWGNGAGIFDDVGYLLSLQGFTGGDGHMFDDSMTEDTSPAINATLKIRIGTTNWWIPLSDTKDCS